MGLPVIFSRLGKKELRFSVGASVINFAPPSESLIRPIRLASDPACHLVVEKGAGKFAVIVGCEIDYWQAPTGETKLFFSKGG